ncbi:MAG TPA: hypothetical protein VFQ68_05560 [Streptosporangiaceae bacterium]|nr:hypothetical protein [Streptosporangiaceae bacterium]
MSYEQKRTWVYAAVLLWSIGASIVASIVDSMLVEAARPATAARRTCGTRRSTGSASTPAAYRRGL